MAVSVHLGGPLEIDAAVDVYRRSGQARHYGTPTPDWRLAEVRATLAEPQTWFFIALDDDTPIGMATAMPSRDNDGDGELVPGLCYLDLIFVVPERWGDGIGALLLDTVIADARGRGFTRIHLLTHDDNDRAQRLYTSRGFERTGWSRPSRMEGAAQVSEWVCAL
jgi:GNAT superfamily N-acetyltransferase